MPGTGGAPPTGEGPAPPETLVTIGADRSFVTAFFKAFPLLISERRAPWKRLLVRLTKTDRRVSTVYSLVLLLPQVGAPGARQEGEGEAAAAAAA